MSQRFSTSALFGFLLITALFIGFAAPKAAEADLSVESRDALLAGELVIYFRHGATTYPGVDRIEWPRERQRLLSEEGIQQSELIGQQAKRLNLPIGDVIASPFARCRDMAEIAFGRVDEKFELLGLLSDRDGRADRVAYLQEQISTPTGTQGNRMIVSHTSNIREVAGTLLQEGEAVLIRPLGNGRFETLETLMPQDWVNIRLPASS